MLCTFFFVIKATVSNIVATIQTKRHAEMNERKSAKELWRILQDGESWTKLLDDFFTNLYDTVPKRTI